MIRRIAISLLLVGVGVCVSFLYQGILARAQFDTSQRRLPRQLDISSCAGDLDCAVSKKDLAAVVEMDERQQIFVEREHAMLSAWEQGRLHLIASYWLQFAETVIIMIFVLSIVIAGIIMSWRHMMDGLGRGHEAGNSIEFGSSGIKLESPVIGLIVFGFSMYFFSVYIDKVYTIRDFESATGKAPAANEPLAASEPSGGN